jgi:hypothetical protein
MLAFAEMACPQTDANLPADPWQPSPAVIDAPLSGDVGTFVGTMWERGTQWGPPDG